MSEGPPSTDLSELTPELLSFSIQTGSRSTPWRVVLPSHVIYFLPLTLSCMVFVRHPIVANQYPPTPPTLFPYLFFAMTETGGFCSILVFWRAHFIVTKRSQKMSRLKNEPAQERPFQFIIRNRSLQADDSSPLSSGMVYARSRQQPA